MFPVLHILPGWSVQAWDALNALAVVVVLAAGMLEARRAGLPWRLVWDLWPWMVAGGVVGAHAYHLLAAPVKPLVQLTAVELLNPLRGTAVQGGMLGGAAAAFLFLRLRGRAVLPVFDVLSPGGALAHAVARLGCFAAGCCFGRPTGLPVGVTFSSALAHPRLPRGVPLHPVQLYEAALDLALAVFLHRRLARGGREGRVFALYLGGYGAIRLATQFLRADDADRLLLGLAHSQYMALAMLAAAVWLWRRAPGTAPIDLGRPGTNT